jgi:hypothetical protein
MHPEVKQHVSKYIERSALEVGWASDAKPVRRLLNAAGFLKKNGLRDTVSEFTTDDTPVRIEHYSAQTQTFNLNRRNLAVSQPSTKHEEFINRSDNTNGCKKWGASPHLDTW